MRWVIATIMGGVAGMAGLAWLLHAPAVPRAWQAISPGMAADAAQRLLGPGCVRNRNCTHDDLNIEIPGDPLLHGKRRWLIVTLRHPASPTEDPDDLAVLQVQGTRTEDGFRADWLYRIPGLDRLL